jgi:fructoselysine-6-P-deglycase FrlB-like protein
VNEATVTSQHINEDIDEVIQFLEAAGMSPEAAALLFTIRCLADWATECRWAYLMGLGSEENVQKTDDIINQHLAQLKAFAESAGVINFDNLVRTAWEGAHASYDWNEALEAAAKEDRQEIGKPGSIPEWLQA